MSKKRQGRLRTGSPRGGQVVSFSRDYPAGHTIAVHSHDRDQLVFACRGVMTVRVSDSVWVVPTNRAVWIPAAIRHSIVMSGEVAMRTLYFKPGLAKVLPRRCCVVNVSPLLEELIVHACSLGPLDDANKKHQHLIDMLIDQFEGIETIPLQLPAVADPRAARVAKMLLANPADQRTHAQLCRSSGASKRTVERLFREETGMTFGKWRQQLCLMHALRLLAEDKKVTHAALEAGYSTPSAFIHAFKAALGSTPTQYFRRGGREWIP